MDEQVKIDIKKNNNFQLKQTGKDELLEELKIVYYKEKNLSFGFVFIVLLIFSLGLMILAPKIYIKNQVYYISRDMSKLYDRYEVLYEENKHLKMELEKQRFKNRVLDTIF